jgi:hypothetical protein
MVIKFGSSRGKSLSPESGAGRARHSVRAAIMQYCLGLRLFWTVERHTRTDTPCLSSGCCGFKKEHGALTTELLVAMALLTFALLPLAYSFTAEKRLARSYYQRAVAMEMVDGEIEVLIAGEWRSYSSGVHDYSVHSAALTNLPPGKFRLEVGKEKVRLEWLPTIPMQGGSVMREARIR